MLGEHDLDLGRAHVHTAGDDDVAAPVDDAQPAGVVERADVAGAGASRPAWERRERGRGVVGREPVAADHRGAADEDLRRRSSSSPRRRRSGRRRARRRPTSRSCRTRRRHAAPRRVGAVAHGGRGGRAAEHERAVVARAGAPASSRRFSIVGTSDTSAAPRSPGARATASRSKPGSTVTGAPAVRARARIASPATWCRGRHRASGRTAPAPSAALQPRPIVSSPAVVSSTPLGVAVVPDVTTTAQTPPATGTPPASARAAVAVEEVGRPEAFEQAGRGRGRGRRVEHGDGLAGGPRRGHTAAGGRGPRSRTAVSGASSGAGIEGYRSVRWSDRSQSGDAHGRGPREQPPDEARTIRPGADWKPGDADYTDIRYETAEVAPGGMVAKITICRPEVRNAFRPRTLFELMDAFERARNDPTVGVVVLTGEGPEAFCSGGDQRIRGDDGYVGDDGIGRLNVLDLQIQIRRLPKPVVAMVAGYAIGGGHVLHVVCDLTDRGRQRALRPDRPAGRLVRRRLRFGPARPFGRPEEGARDLVPVPAVRRAGRRSTWVSSTRSCRSRTSRSRRSRGARGCSSTARSRCG